MRKTRPKKGATNVDSEDHTDDDNIDDDNTDDDTIDDENIFLILKKL